MSPVRGGGVRYGDFIYYVLLCTYDLLTFTYYALLFYMLRIICKFLPLNSGHHRLEAKICHPEFRGFTFSRK